MIDTIELMCRVPEEKVEIVKAAINLFAESIGGRWLHKNNDLSSKLQCYRETGAFYTFGMLQVALINYKFIKSYYRLILKYKPAQVIYGDDPYALSGQMDYERAIKNADYFLAQLNSFLNGYTLPQIKFWKVNRIDYSFEFFTPFHQEYLHLLKKGYGRMQEDKYATTVYVIGENTNINFYDKTVKLWKKMNTWEEDKEHCLRFEVQCKCHYIDHLLRKYGWHDDILYHLWSIKLAQNIVLNKVHELIGDGDFYDLSTAKARIQASFSSKKAAKLIKLLKPSLHFKTRARHLAAIYSRQDAKADIGYVNLNLIPALNKIGINQLLLPADWKITRLETPAGIITRQNC